MELFRVRCITCSARLSVRNRSAIGQILACPRCSSMVEITPPAGWVDPDRGEESLIAIRVTESTLREEPTETATADQSSSQLQRAAAASAPAPVDAGPVDEAANRPFTEIDQSGPALDELQTQPRVTSQEPSNEPQDAPSVENPVENNAEVADALGSASNDVAVDSADTIEQPTPAELSAAVGATKLTTIAYVAAAVVAGGTLLGAWLLWGGDDEQPETTTRSPAAALAPSTENESRNPQNSAATESAEGRTVAATNNADNADPMEVAARRTDQSPAATLPNIAGPNDAAARQDSSADANVNAVEVESTTVAVELPATADRHTVQRPEIDALDIDPEGLDLSFLFDDPQALPEADDATAEPSGNQQRQTAEHAANDQVDSSARPSEFETVRLDPTRPSAVKLPDPDVVLAQRFPRFEIQSMPLCRFVDFATQLSGLPVSVSSQQLRMAGVSAGSTVSVELTDATLEDALTAALKPRRLRPVQTGAGLELQCTRDDALRTVAFTVDDLTSASLPIDQLATWLSRLTAPNAWNKPGVKLNVADGKLSSVQYESVQYELLVLLEKLRRSQGIQVQTTYPSGLIPARSPYVDMTKKLAAPTTFTYSQFTPLRAIFRDWQEELGTPVLVDWTAMAEIQLGPQSRIACSASQQSWAEAIDSVLGPLDLAWRAVDGPALQITTFTSAYRDGETQIYRLPRNARATAAELNAEIDRLADELLDPSTPLDTATFVHPTAPIVLARQPAIVHRAIVQWLRKNNALSPRTAGE